MNGKLKVSAGTDRNFVKVAILSCEKGYRLDGDAVSYCNQNQPGGGNYDPPLGTCTQDNGDTCSSSSSDMSQKCVGSPTTAIGCPNQAQKAAQCKTCTGEECADANGNCQMAGGGGGAAFANRRLQESCPSGTVSCKPCNICTGDCIKSFVAHSIKGCAGNPSGMWGMYAPLLGKACIPH